MNNDNGSIGLSNWTQVLTCYTSHLPPLSGLAALEPTKLRLLNTLNVCTYSVNQLPTCVHSYRRNVSVPAVNPSEASCIDLFSVIEANQLDLATFS
jgi:hypothetical protein